MKTIDLGYWGRCIIRLNRERSSCWLLLCEAMQCSEAPYQIDGMNSHHGAIGEKFS